MPWTVPQVTADPCFCWRLLDTPRQVWVSRSWGHCSFLLGPDVHKVLSVPFKSLFPQSCVSSGGSVLGLMVTSSRGLMPYPGLLHPEPLPLRQATADPSLHRLKHSKAGLAQSLMSTRFCLSPLCLWWVWGDSKRDFAPSYHLAVASPFPFYVR